MFNGRSIVSRYYLSQINCDIIIYYYQLYSLFSSIISSTSLLSKFQNILKLIRSNLVISEESTTLVCLEGEK